MGKNHISPTKLDLDIYSAFKDAQNVGEFIIYLNLYQSVERIDIAT